MLQGLIGKKTYQSQGFLQDGTRVPLSGVLVGDSFVSQIKTEEKDGYNAIQIAFQTKKNATKAVGGHSKKAGLIKTARFLKEIRADDVSGLKLGSKIAINDIFKPGDIVNVTGVSKGKGWAGVVKRWHFKGGPRTHGQSDRERAPGSIGQTTTPGRVYKGKKMAGKMGDTTATVRNLEVIEITDDGIVLVKGLIPGHINSLVMIKKVGENKKFVPLYREIKEEKVEEAAGETQQPSEGKPSVSASLSESQSTESESVQSSEDGLTPDSSESETSPANSEDGTTDSGYGQATPDSSENSSTVEAPRRASEGENGQVPEVSNEDKKEDK